MTDLILYSTEDGRSQIKLQADLVDKAEKKTPQRLLKQRPKK